MKLCKACLTSKPLSEFYANTGNRCKECVKAASMERHIRMSKDADWVERELERHREKSREYRDAGRAKKETEEQRRIRTQRHREKHPEAVKARRSVSNAIRDGRMVRQPCEVCGKEAQAHHEDYNQPLRVKWLCVTHHAEADILKRNKDRKTLTVK